MSDQRPFALIVSPAPNTRGGGVERFCALIADVLSARGWRSEEIGPDGPPPRNLARIGGGPLWESRSALRHARGRGADLIVSNGQLGGFAPKDVPRLHCLHGTIAGYALAPGAGHPPRMKARWVLGGGAAERLALHRATSVAVSQWAADESRRLYRAPVDAVIPNGVDQTRFHPRDQAEARARFGLPAEGRLALYSGRFAAYKGAEKIISACERAGWQLVVAGPQAPGVGTYLGMLDHEDLPWAYAAADCVLLPTAYEGCSYVILETMACGIPILTTEVGWMPTLLAAVPEYRELLIDTDASTVGDLLAAWPDDGHARLTAAAAAFVDGHNTMQTFGAQWGEMIARTAPEADARGRAFTA